MTFDANPEIEYCFNKVVFGSALERLPNVRIIVAEDHDDSRTFMGLFLARMGATVVLAKDAIEGLEAVKNHHPDLVLTDIQMPGLDGFWLLREIRSLHSDEGGEVPVVAFTALDTRTERIRLVKLGFQACVQKPFTPEQLLETMFSLLKK